MCPYEKELIKQNVDALLPLFSVKVPAVDAGKAKLFIEDFVTSIVPNLCDYLYDDLKFPVDKLFEEVGSIYSVIEKDLVDSFNSSSKSLFFFSSNKQVLDNTFEHPPLPSKNDVKKTLEEYLVVLKKDDVLAIGLGLYKKVSDNIDFGTVWANTEKDVSFYLSLDPGLATVLLKVIKGETVKEYYIPYEMIGVDSKNNKIKYLALLTPNGYFGIPLI